MDSTLHRCRAWATAALAAAAVLLAPPLAAATPNHDLVVSPLRPGPFAVACSNVEHDMARLASLGGVPSDYWEGHEVNGATRYITEVLAHPESAVVYRAPVPLKLSLYPTHSLQRVEFAAIVCYPTSRTNTDPNYVLPGAGGTVPHMQPAGASAKLVSDTEYAQTLGLTTPTTGGPQRLPLVVYSHGLGGSPLGKGYIDVMVQLAAQGYMVAAIFHADNRFSKVRIEDLGDLAYAIVFFPLVVEMMAMRPLGLKAMTDVLLTHPDYGRGIDATRIGGFGASLGGQAMMHLLGARITASLSKSCEDPVYDARIRAGVGYVPYAGQSFLPAFCDGQEGAQYIDRPFLGMSGTEDLTAPMKLAQQAINRAQSSRYLVQLVGGKHELRPEDAGDVLTWMVTFLNAYLDVPGDPGAMARLIRMAGVAGGGTDEIIVDVHVSKHFPGDGAMPTAEFYNAELDRFSVAAGESEIAAKSAQAGWVPTHHAFSGWVTAPATTAFATLGVCRFRDAANAREVLAFGDAECDFMRRARGLHYVDTPLYVVAPNADGTCFPGSLAIHRLYKPSPGRFGRDARDYRLTTSDSTLRDMLRGGWVAAPTAGCAVP